MLNFLFWYFSGKNKQLVKVSDFRRIMKLNYQDWKSLPKDDLKTIA
jgi:hypothetical protein